MLFEKIKYKIAYILKYSYYYFIPNFNNFINFKFKFIKTTFNVRTIFRGTGNIQVGHNCIFGSIMGGSHKYGTVELQARYSESNIILGNNIWTNNNLLIISANKVEIGSNTMIGQNVTIMDFEAHGINAKKRKSIGLVGSIIIGENVWIGNNVTILKNSEIGDNSIIAAGAVVSGRFPENVIIGGVPAKFIKTINE
jgi:acetyltransferase-like isoleucine patch superfamily enzyme